MGNWFTSLFGKNKKKRKPSASGDLIVWSEEYEIGHDLIDQQHQTLVNMINELNRIVAGQGSREDTEKILSKLIDYTVFHFSGEEEIFKNSAYPCTAAHIEKHEDLVQKITEFWEEFRNNRADVSDELLEFLTDWLTNHIQGTDRGYKDFI